MTDSTCFRPATIKYFLDPEEAKYDYSVKSDPNALLLRSKHEHSLIPDTRNCINVSPVSSSRAAGSYDPAVELILLATFVIVPLAVYFCFMTVDCCCGRALNAWDRRRRAVAHRRVQAQALSQWGNPTAESISLRALSSRCALNHMKSPVKQNLRKIEAPQTIVSELADLRANGHPLAGAHRDPSRV